MLNSIIHVLCRSTYMFLNYVVSKQKQQQQQKKNTMMFLKLYTNLYKTDMHKQASFVALNCLTVAKSLHNTSQINSWVYYCTKKFERMKIVCVHRSINSRLLEN